MNSFFRWASIVITLGVIAIGVVYFVWLRDVRLLSGAPVSSITPSAMTITGPGSVVIDPRLAAVATLPADVVTPQPLVTQEPRQAVVIAPALATQLPVGHERGGDDSTTAAGDALSSDVSAPNGSDNLTTLVPAPTTPQPAVDNQNSSRVLTLVAPALRVSPPDGDAAAWLRPADVQIPDSLAFGISTPAVRAQIVVHAVVTAMPLSDLLPTLTPIVVAPGASQPRDSSAPAPLQLYRAPDPNAALPGETVPRAALDIVARDTTGRWFLLVSGLWVQAATVENPPSMLPLVVPTATPTPTNTGFPTPTEEPEPTFTPLPTATPTPTSLDFAVCDCTRNTYACVAHDFPVRVQAQACFEYCFRQTGLDVHNLDPDGNGLACENLAP